MAGNTDARRTDTRQQIRLVALELFAERGYDQTSLREIAERLGVTKAAVYYHYRTKEDILAGLLDEQIAGMAEIIGWGRGQPPGPARRREVLERYNALLVDTYTTAPQLIRFLHERQTSIKDLAGGAEVLERFRQLRSLLVEPDAAHDDRLRAQLALLALHLGAFSQEDTDDGQERTGAALRVALELAGTIRRADGGEPRPARGRRGGGAPRTPARRGAKS